jgi:hypothetical protein
MYLRKLQLCSHAITKQALFDLSFGAQFPSAVGCEDGLSEQTIRK